MTFDWLANLVASVPDEDVEPERGIPEGSLLTHRNKLLWHIFGPGANKMLTRTDSRKNLAKAKAINCLNLAKPEFRHILERADCPPPPCSRGAFITLEWQMDTPFFSRSSYHLDAIDNPICRDTVTLQPLLHASGAKGMLAQVMRQIDPDLSETLLGPDPETMRRDMNAARSGRLVPGDVFFDQVSHDVFSPHFRNSGVVDKPVTFEVVPQGATAKWSMLLWERIPGEFSTNALRRSLELLLQSLKVLLLEVGMSAKRTSGYGLAKSQSLSIVILPGRKVRGLPDSSRDEEIEQRFEEPEPDLPSETVRKPEFKHRALLIDGGLCAKKDAAELLVEARCKEKKLTYTPPSGQESSQLHRIRKKCQKNAEKAWNEARRMLEQMTPEAVEERQRATLLHDEWARRKEAHRTLRQHSYSFDSFDAGLEALRRIEVEP